MFDSTLSAVISIDADANTVHFCAENPGQRPSHVSAGFQCDRFDEDFFQRFEKLLQGYIQKNSAAALAKTSFVLPDHLFLKDLLTVPTIGKKATENSVELAVGAIYKNKKDLKYNTYPLMQNKQTSTYAMVGIRKEILDRLREVCNAKQVSIQNVTFAANAMVNGAIAGNPRLKNGTFLLLDVQEKRCRFAFVNKGRTVGSYGLPFGTNMLLRTRLAAEDLLFDHATGELLVLNAKEKAKAKQLTMMGEEVMVDPDSLSPDSRDGAEEDIFSAGYGNDGRKTARRLPKFMQRDIPSDKEGFIYENFRIIMKWALDLIASNTGITAAGAMEAIYVNMPGEYDFLFDRINSEEEENGVRFLPLADGGDMAGELTLSGGFYVKQYNKMNNF